MKTRILFCLLGGFAVLAACLAVAAQVAAAPPSPPLPIFPAEGDTIGIPKFSWAASDGAAKYELEVGPQSDPNTVYWTGETVNLTLTPLDALKFANIPLYWRVRGVDSSNAAGAWSSKLNFTKVISAPTLVSPAHGSSLVLPVLEWQVVQVAAYYKVELSTSPTFIVIEATYTTYNTRLTPANSLAHGTHYWRVYGVDPDGHLGTPSAGWSFTKDIASPVLVSPPNGHPNIHIPTLEWQASQGAAYYKVELSTSPTFVPIEATYTTYNTRLTPVAALTLGLHYWRVSGVDAAGHVGTPGTGWSFTTFLEAPVLVSPAVNATLTTPTMEWAAVEGAAYYKVELSTAASFVPIAATYTTYNLRLTPETALALNTYYWRVSGVDAAGHVGAANWRKFTLIAPSAPVDPVPQLIGPLDMATITTDPTFTWSRVVGAADYRLIVSQYADFHANYDSLYPDYDSYTPSAAGDHDAYPNGTYYWKVQARNGSGVVIATSAAWSFTKQQALPLVGPADGAAGLVVDPTFQWSQVVGADHYRLIVSQYADFHAYYDSLYPDYNSYTPYTAGDHVAYTNDAYYWKVQALDSGGALITTSEARSFTKDEPMPLIAPNDGAGGLVVDPTYEWSQVVGANHYRLIVSLFADFHAYYDSLYPDYTGYTPYSAGDHVAYANGTYYWKVQALDSGGTPITTSAARSFTKQEPVALITPADGSLVFAADTTFQWTRVVGADHYRVIVSLFPDFHANYDSVYPDYPLYTPYSLSMHSPYANGLYYWKVQALDSGGTPIATSSVWSFTVGMNFKQYLPVAVR